MKTFNQVAVSFSERVTIFVSATRSYASLAKAVGIVNTNLYGSDAFEEDRIEFNPVASGTERSRRRRTSVGSTGPPDPENKFFQITRIQYIYINQK